MNKRDLIQKICELDGSYSPSYLAGFNQVDLEYHLHLLQSTRKPIDRSLAETEDMALSTI
jgi:hypothetical protein